MSERLTNFKWLIEGKLAGSAMPGVYDDKETSLRFLTENGISQVISLTEEYPSQTFAPINAAHHHFPISDMGVPDIKSLKRLIKEIDTHVHNKEVVLVHCKAGLGRTGIVLAAYLIAQGTEAPQAIAHIRTILSGYVQHSMQERFLSAFALAF